MLVFTVLLLTTSSFAKAAVLPVGSSLPSVDFSTTYKPPQEFVGRNVEQPQVEGVVPQQGPVVQQPVYQQRQPVVVGRHVQPVQQPYRQSVFINRQPHYVQPGQVQPVHQQQTFVKHVVDPAVNVPQSLVPVQYQSRNAFVDPGFVQPQHQQPFNVVPKSPVVVEPKHHVPSHIEAGVEPKSSMATARILQQDMDVSPDGSFFNVWDSDNGIKVQEHGTLKHVGDHDVTVEQGEISYVDNDGNTYNLKYVADENGFHVQGDHLPTPPPLPPAIARGLEYIAAHPYVETTTPSQEEYQQPGQTPAVFDN